jgi:hypothetical protein
MNLGDENFHLRRTSWDAFPDVVILSEEQFVKTHPLYSSAKEGNPMMAEGLVDDVMVGADLMELRRLIGSSHPFLLPVHALETEGMNVIPRVFARALSQLFNLPLFSGVIPSESSHAYWSQRLSQASISGDF